MTALSAHPDAPPIPMRLWCPRCGAQHVDKPEPELGWTNPPHKSHTCQVCSYRWRPADFNTVGVAAIATRGEDDTPEGAPVHHIGEPGEVDHPAMARLLAGWLALALDYSRAAQRVQNTNPGEAGGYSSRAEMLAFCSQELFTLLRDVKFFEAAEGLPLIQEAELWKIIRYGVTGDRTRVIAYVHLLADKVEAAGDTETAATLRRYAAGDFGLEVRPMAKRARE